MADQGFWDDPANANKRVAILKTTKGVCERYDRLAQDLEEIDLLMELAEEDDSVDTDVEVGRALADMESRFDQLELETLLSGAYDRGGAVVTIQSGAGGTDASDWAEMLLRMYSHWAQSQGLKAKLIEALEHEEAGIKHATLEVTGDLSYGYLSCEAGVHRLVRISPFDAQGRRQTSFAAVDVVPLLEEDDELEVEEKDLKIDTYRAGGKGGQHVNKTESAVRITHMPTGIVVQCQTERSQHKNRATAMKFLKARLIQAREAERNAEIQSLYDSKGEIAWGSQIRSYVMAPYQLVKDLRTQHETGNVQAVLDGAVQPFIEAMLRHRIQSRQSS